MPIRWKITAALKEYPDFEPFCRDNAFWLEDYALYMSLKEGA